VLLLRIRGGPSGKGRAAGQESEPLVGWKRGGRPLDFNSKAFARREVSEAYSGLGSSLLCNQQMRAELNKGVAWLADTSVIPLKE